MDAEQRAGLDFLCGLTEAFPQSVLVELVPNGKQSRKSWDHFERLHLDRGHSRLDLAERWWKAGWGVGILPRGGLWCLDLDSSEAEEVVTETLVEGGWCPPRVRTPSGGVHLWPRLPAGLITKNHVCHPKNADGEKFGGDFKFGPRTLVVAPGTIRNGRCYTPETDWCMPPCLHPEVFLPGIQIEPKREPFLVHQGSQDDRVKAACGYLCCAGVSIQGKCGHRQLRRVAGNLVGWFGMDPGFAVWLMTHSTDRSWNDRCSPPWSLSELWKACEAAADDAPELGVEEWKKTILRGNIQAFLDQVRNEAMRQGAWCFTEELRRCCEGFLGETITATLFGRMVNEAAFKKGLRTKARLSAIEQVDLDLVLELTHHHHHQTA